jgi:AcrR family transcriptional regulator
MIEEILQKSKDVLKQKGLQNTTFRDIAKELKISDGHVRYYFKTKEILLLALFKKMDEEILALSNQDLSQENIIEILRLSLQKTFKIMADYHFFFLESPHVLKTFPQVFAAYSQLFEQRKTLFLMSFQIFRSNNVFRADVSDDELNLLFNQFFIFSDSWMRFHYLQHTTSLTNTDIENYADLALNLISPYFKK